MKNSISVYVLGAIVVSFSLIACSQRDMEIRVYQVAKAISPQESIAAPPSGRNAAQGLAWTTPSGWTQKEASGMRLASFGVSGGKGDSSIVVLGGDAGGLTANVNRWRDQAGLGPQSDAEVAQAGAKHKGKLGEFQVFKIEGAAEKDSMLAAVFALADRSVFVKLTGKTDTIRAEEKRFVELCKSLRTADAGKN